MKSGLFGRGPGARRLSTALFGKLLELAGVGGGQGGGAAGGDFVQTGVIRKEEGEAQHWEVNEDGDLMVSVTMDHHQVPVWALFAPLVGGTNLGVWVIPPEGTEVVVAFPDDDFSGDAVVVGCLAHTPSDLTAARVLVMGAEVWVYNGSGTPQPVALADHRHSPSGLSAGGDPVTGTMGTSNSNSAVLKAT